MSYNYRKLDLISFIVKDSQQLTELRYENRSTVLIRRSQQSFPSQPKFDFFISAKVSMSCCLRKKCIHMGISIFVITTSYYMALDRHWRMG